MGFTQFEATDPVIEPASTEKVFDKFWLSSLRIQAPEPTRPAKLVAIWEVARDETIQIPHTDDAGVVSMVNISYKVLKKDAPIKRLIINDLFGEAEKDPLLAQALETIIVSLKDKANKEGIL
jgi:hypothetical protein